MHYATTDSDGRVTGFYHAGFHGPRTHGDGSQNPATRVPAEAIEITQATFQDWFDNQHARAWRDGALIEVAPPATAVASWRERRRAAYPPLRDQIEALTEAAAGRPEKLVTVLASIREVKDRIPKEETVAHATPDSATD